ncbi:MAG TPA: FAD binding domain-containing protein [Acidimicrobiales bacterium]|nr:FAD binding domain-containing protein [Acidimicrobiales bacterium]
MLISTPTTIGDALVEISNENTLAVGGGTSIALMLKNRLIEPDRLVLLNQVPALSGIEERDAQTVRIGATTTLLQLMHSPLINSALPVLSFAASRVGNPRVRSVATVGGAIIHGDPRQDIPPVLLSLGATAHIAGRAGERDVPLAEFFIGFMESAAGEDELVTEVTVPKIAGQRTHYTRFTPGSDDDYPTVGIAVAMTLADDGSVKDARIALGGVDSTAFLATEAASLLIGNRPTDELIAAVGESAAKSANPSDDQRGSERYKRAMVDVWTRRTLAICLKG